MRHAQFTVLTLLGLLASLIFTTVTTSCISDEMTTSSHDVLSFSRDTVNFDTVFTDLGTPTARLVVRNRAKKGLNISSIRFKNPNSNFSMNVDGMSGRDFKDVEIRGKDSIFMFIECYIPETQGNAAGLVEDAIEFVTNGVTQTVRLEAYGQNVTRLRNVRVKSDMTLTADRPYVVFDSLTVEPAATLTIQPGAQVLFHDGASLVVEGKLLASGSPGKMIALRGDRLDNVLPNVEYDIMAGQWKGIRIAPESFDNRLDFVDMRSTVHGLLVDSCADLSHQKLTITNSWLHNSQASVLQSKYAKVDAYGVCFSEAADAVVSLTGGSHEFLQCTFANNYLFSAIRNPLLSLYHALEKDRQPGNARPLMKASFSNSIIYGLTDDLNIGDFADSDVYFRYVSLKSGGKDDEHFLNCLWETDPMFYTVRSDYYFNYRLQQDSPCKAAADRALVTPAVQYDMDGTDRLSGEGPSLGAYQYVARPQD